MLSLLLKRHGVKTFPVPLASHEPHDPWAWEAGFCDTSPVFHPRASGRGGGADKYEKLFGGANATESVCGKALAEDNPKRWWAHNPALGASGERRKSRGHVSH